MCFLKNTWRHSDTRTIAGQTEIGSIETGTRLAMRPGQTRYHPEARQQRRIDATAAIIFFAQACGLEYKWSS